MPNPPCTRRDLRRALVVNALTKPANVLAPASVMLATILLGAPWLVPVAVVCWLALVAQTFFDEREATRVGERARLSRPRAVAYELPRPPTFAALEIAARVRAARSARASIQVAVGGSASPLEDVAREVDALVVALEGHAVRAQRIREFLDGEAPDDLRERVRRRLDQLFEEMDHVVTALQTVHAEILVTDGLEQGALAGRVSELRANVQAVSAGLEEAFAQTRAG
jgi:hypothetical protein